MMDWNSKWDWENFVLFDSKASEIIPKKLQFADFSIGDDGELDGGPLNRSTGGGNSATASGSDGWHASSAKSSISASTESSTKYGGMQTPSFRLMTTEDATQNISMVIDKADDVYGGASPPPEASSVGSLEPLIGLKLGKRTYFEDTIAAGNVKTSSFGVNPAPSATSLNRSKSLGQVRPIARCVVEGCSVDLSTAKDYHRKHRVCESHSKCSKVVVGGLERRFCQQCSRFHNLVEFDDKKRSCRRRLLDHNARRRKPQPVNSTCLSSPFYGTGRREMSFLSNNAPHFFSRNYASNTWDSPCNSIPAIKLSSATNLHVDTPIGLFASKNSVPEVSNPGSKVSMASSHLDTAPDYGRALSLLSTNSWGSCGTESTTQYYSLHDNFHSVNQPMMLAIPEGLPLSSPEFYLPIHQSGSSQPRDGQEIQFYRNAYESDFYSNHYPV